MYKIDLTFRFEKSKKMTDRSMSKEDRIDLLKIFVKTKHQVKIRRIVNEKRGVLFFRKPVGLIEFELAKKIKDKSEEELFMADIQAKLLKKIMNHGFVCIQFLRTAY